jgi:hypothetical protein
MTEPDAFIPAAEPGEARDLSETSSEHVGDPTVAKLAREIYWAREGPLGSVADTASVRDRLQAFAHQMQVEHRQLVPTAEGVLGSTTGWRRKTKLVLWRVLRFQSRRYEQLLADLAELSAELAERLHDTETELDRLREERARDGSGEP